MKYPKICITLLIAVICCEIQAQSIRRYFDNNTKECCVEMNGKRMTVDEYDFWLHENHRSKYAKDTVLESWMKFYTEPEPEDEHGNYRDYTFSTRSMQWGNKRLTAWVMLGSKGQECSRWVFPGRGRWVDAPGLWSIEKADEEFLYVVYHSLSMCSRRGRVDKNGNLYILTEETDAMGNDLYKPWIWSEEQCKIKIVTNN